ncbi:hypothetical protein BKP37_12605 [Anaerobacillus alkalilacustris]|uniref:Uncharacterized protein n=1 Tax=Anaerobacillus alkalilacustris TaxID=393763 RepID=A0A1S2LJD3_9BACI|nr:hypothetical protein [Anaerobacillus alkalilacustris]OIJ12638.1 hypothetical protein BKP37_12605 [Anaerobacillus alkalilacustris]
MKKIKVVKKFDFKSREFYSLENKSSKKIMKRVLTAAGPALFLLSPKTLADGTAPAVVAVVAPEETLTDAETTFKDIYDAIMGIFDAGVVLVIIFAGAAWALGHRTKAIEIVIGVCCGYLLARHAIDIRDFLKSIGSK